MGFSCKSTGFVLAARGVPRNATPSKADFQVSCALNEFMSIACSTLFLPCSGLPAKQHFKGSWDATPGTHSRLNSVREREVPNPCSEL